MKKKKKWLYVLLGLVVLGLAMPKKEKTTKVETVPADYNVVATKDDSNSSDSSENEPKKEREESSAKDNDSNESSKAEQEKLKPATTSAKKIDRGITEDRNHAPNYVGMTGYIGARPPAANDNVDSLNSNWTVPYYTKDKNAIIEAGTLPNKTKFKVLAQDIEHTHHGIYTGYLTIQPDGTDDEVLIDVDSFVQEPWFELPLDEAAAINSYLATYHQRSEEYPYNERYVRTNDPNYVYTDIPDGVTVLVDRDAGDGYVHGYIFTQWKYGFGGVAGIINVEDLDYSY